MLDDDPDETSVDIVEVHSNVLTEALGVLEELELLDKLFTGEALV